jgi:hypothetical protein
VRAVRPGRGPLEGNHEAVKAAIAEAQTARAEKEAAVFELATSSRKLVAAEHEITTLRNERDEASAKALELGARLSERPGA